MLTKWTWCLGNASLRRCYLSKYHFLPIQPGWHILWCIFVGIFSPNQLNNSFSVLEPWYIVLRTGVALWLSCSISSSPHSEPSPSIDPGGLLWIISLPAQKASAMSYSRQDKSLKLLLTQDSISFQMSLTVTALEWFPCLPLHNSHTVLLIGSLPFLWFQEIFDGGMSFLLSPSRHNEKN